MSDEVFGEGGAVGGREGDCFEGGGDGEEAKEIVSIIVERIGVVFGVTGREDAGLDGMGVIGCGWSGRGRRWIEEEGERMRR